MFDWTDEQRAMRDAVREFVNKEVLPIREELEYGDLPPYAVIRQLYATFGLDQLAEDRFVRQVQGGPAEGGDDADPGFRAASTLIPMIELSRCSPGIVTAMGVSANLTSGTIMRQGSPEQKERWARDLMTFRTVGAWAITEPDSGSDAFGSMAATARQDGDDFILNGSKTFITNGPFADTIVFICKLDEGNVPRERKIVTFVLGRGMPGLEQTPPLRKMGLHSSPTGQLFLSDVRADRSRLLDSPPRRSSGHSSADKSGPKAAFASERASMAAMALGIIEKCLELSVDYARERRQFGRSIGEFQLIQQKLAWMEVARLNVQNHVLRYIGMRSAGQSLTLAEASAMKLYSAGAAVQVAMEAVQLFGGNGYMAEFHVEQLARDAKVLQIYAGTDEIQTVQIAKDLLRG